MNLLRKLIFLASCLYLVACSSDKMPQKMRGLIRGALAMDTGYMSYPNIYFGKEHIGGLDDLKSHL